MNIKQAIAGAVIGCTLSVAGAGAAAGVANAAPPCPPNAGAQCGPGGPGGPAAEGPGDPGGPPPDDFRGPGDHGGPGGPGGPPQGDFHGPGDHGGPGGPAAHRRTTSTDLAITTGGRHGTRRTTTGADASTAHRGVMDCRRGAGAHRRRPRGTDRCHPLGDRHPRPSITSASMSSRYGIPATTNGASGSSESGFRCRSKAVARQSIHLSE